MSRQKKSPPRGWQFWRRAFWTRPALLVLYGIGVGGVGVGLLAAVPNGVGDAISMRRAAGCPASPVRAEPKVDPPAGCLERVPVRLSGPWHQRGPGSRWRLLVERDGRLVPYARTNVSTVGSRRLADDARADALLWKGTPVAIELPGHGRVETEAWGHRGWILTLASGMFALSGLPMLIEAARLKRRTADGWWSVRGEAVRPLLLTPLMGIACLLAVPSMLAFVPLLLGVGLPWAVGVGVLGLALVGYAVGRVANSSRRRRADTSPAASRS